MPCRVVGTNMVSLTESALASGGGDALSTQGFAFFATTVLTRFLIAFLKLQPFEQAVILNFFLQNPHGLFKIVVEDLDFNCFQPGSTPLFPIATDLGMIGTHDGYLL
jgi:hypothetical protein